MKCKNILFPVDFSDCSRALNTEVEYLAQRFNSDVTLLHVFEIPFTWYGFGEAPIMNAECLKEYFETEKRRLKEYPIQISESKLHRITAEGDPARQIKQCVLDTGIDLVVMGKRLWRDAPLAARISSHEGASLPQLPGVDAFSEGI